MAYPKIDLKFSLDPADLQKANAPDGYKIYRGEASDPCPNGDCSGSTPIANGSISPSDTEIVYTDTTASDGVPYYYRSEYTRSSDGSATSGVKVGPIMVEGQSTLGHPGTLPGYGTKTPFECSVAPMFHFDANSIAQELDVANSTATNDFGEKYQHIVDILPYNRSFFGSGDALSYQSSPYTFGIVKQYSLDTSKHIISTSNNLYGLLSKLMVNPDQFKDTTWFFDKGYTSVFLFSTSPDNGSSFVNSGFDMNGGGTIQHQVRVSNMSQSYHVASKNPDDFTFQRISDGKFIPNPILEIQEIQIENGTRQRSAEFPGLPKPNQLNTSSDYPDFPGQYCDPNKSRYTIPGGLASYGRGYHGSEVTSYQSHYLRTPTSKDRFRTKPDKNGLHIAVFRMQSPEEAKAQGKFPLYQIWMDGSLAYSDRIYRTTKRTNGSIVNFGDLGYSNWDGLTGGTNQSDDVYIPTGPGFHLFTPTYNYSATQSYVSNNLLGTCFMDVLQFSQSLNAKDLGQIIGYLQSKAGNLLIEPLGGYQGL